MVLTVLYVFLDSSTFVFFIFATALQIMLLHAKSSSKIAGRLTTFSFLGALLTLCHVQFLRVCSIDAGLRPLSPSPFRTTIVGPFPKSPTRAHRMPMLSLCWYTSNGFTGPQYNCTTGYYMYVTETSICTCQMSYFATALTVERPGIFSLVLLFLLIFQGLECRYLHVICVLLRPPFGNSLRTIRPRKMSPSESVFGLLSPSLSLDSLCPVHTIMGNAVTLAVIILVLMTGDAPRHDSVIDPHPLSTSDHLFVSAIISAQSIIRGWQHGTPDTGILLRRSWRLSYVGKSKNGCHGWVSASSAVRQRATLRLH